MSTIEKKKYFCGHCNAFVSKTLYYKHKKLYYDRRAKAWKSNRVVKSSEDGVLEEDFVLSANSSDDDSADNMDAVVSGYNEQRSECYGKVYCKFSML